jgi:hypothetical protein
MYHFYQPVRPASNLYLQKLIDDQHYNNHIRKLYGIKTGDSYKTKYAETSSEYPHIRNHQRVQRQKQIAKENFTTRLLKHIADDSKKRVDDRNEYEQKSLLYPKRKNDIMKQSLENLSLLNRLENVKPVVSKNVLGKEWDKQKVYASIITRYPENWRHYVNQYSFSKDIFLKIIIF